MFDRHRSHPQQHHPHQALSSPASALTIPLSDPAASSSPFLAFVFLGAFAFFGLTSPAALRYMNVRWDQSTHGYAWELIGSPWGLPWVPPLA